MKPLWIQVRIIEFNTEKVELKIIGTSIKSIMGSRTGVFIVSSVSDTSNANLSRAPDISGFALPGL